MSSYEIGDLSALVSRSPSVSEKQKKKAKKLKNLFSTPLPIQKQNVNESVAENKTKGPVKKVGIQLDSTFSPIEGNKKNRKRKRKKIAKEQTQEVLAKPKKKRAKKVNSVASDAGTVKDDDHPQKKPSVSEKNVDSNEKPIKMKKRKREDSESNKEFIKIDETRDARTVFVGNLPTSFDKENLKCLFRQFGKVESARIRSAVPPKASLPKKVAVIKQLYHPNVYSFNGFVVFETEEMACAALELNGAKVQDHHIRVDIANKNQEHDHKRSIFVGNLPFDIQDDDLWDFFKECGEIRQVRAIKDKETRIGKGFGYILFKTVDAAALALEKNGEKLNGRPLRISRSTKKEKKFPKEKLSNEDRKKLHANRSFQGNKLKERLRIKKNKKIVKNRLRLKKKKIIAQKLQSSLKKASSR